MKTIGESLGSPAAMKIHPTHQVKTIWADFGESKKQTKKLMNIFRTKSLPAVLQAITYLLHCTDKKRLTTVDPRQPKW